MLQSVMQCNKYLINRSPNKRQFPIRCGELSCFYPLYILTSPKVSYRHLLSITSKSIPQMRKVFPEKDHGNSYLGKSIPQTPTHELQSTIFKQSHIIWGATWQYPKDSKYFFPVLAYSSRHDNYKGRKRIPIGWR